MTALRQDKHLCLRRLAGDAGNLFQRPIFIIRALYGQHRARNTGQFGLDVPVAKRRVQPDSVPAPEGRIDVGMVARQPLTQPAGQVGVARQTDACDTDIFDKNMRSEDDNTAQVFCKARRMQKRYGTAVAVTEQPGTLYAQCVQQRRQYLDCLAVHEVGLPALICRARRRIAVAIARVDQAAQAMLLAELLRKILPHRHRAQAFVQEHHDRQRWVGAAHPSHFQRQRPAAPVEFYVGWSRAVLFRHLRPPARAA